MHFGQEVKIKDVCLLVEDIERTVDFYVNKLGFKMRRRAEGFADFHNGGVILAAWELGHINAHTGVSSRVSPRGAHKVCIAVELGSPEEVDGYYKSLTANGVPFYGEPANHVWNARCAYFTDPDDTLWELYAWLKGGPGDYHEEHAK
ncbi:MAG: VOC family protein [Phyllobacterium sp.]|uniref:VOC family protein n=1 Tax=Phyllobacterium sp. TaxID=1871046 RepID=UPI0030F02363